MFKRLLPVVLALTAFRADAAIQYYLTTGDAQHNEAAFGADLLALGLLSSGNITFTGEGSGTTLTDIGTTLVDFIGTSTITVAGSQAQFISSSSGDTLRVDFPSGVYAFGIHLVSASGSGGWNYRPLGGPNAGSFSLGTGGFFFGAISTTPFAELPSIVFTAQAGNKYFYMNDFSIGTLNGSSETPEPSTFALLGSILVAVPLATMRRRRAAAR